MIELKKILIIEDEPELVSVLKQRLEKCSFSVDSALDGQVGLTKAKKQKPDVILLDLMMPQVDGYEVCYELKNNPDTKDIIIIVVSAQASKENQKEILSRGANAFLEKPFEPSELVELIQNLLQEKSS